VSPATVLVTWYSGRPLAVAALVCSLPRETSWSFINHRTRRQAEGSKVSHGSPEDLRTATQTLHPLAPHRYADPPWTPDFPHRNHSSAAYTDMLRSLQTLPVRKVSKRNTHLHLCTLPESFLAAIQVLRDWGFRYRTHLLRMKPPADYGCYWRPSHELLLLGVRGTLAFRDNSLLSYDDEQSPSPAGKSASTRRLIERASPEPYLDLFGCGSTPGWTFAANESRGSKTPVWNR